jgi:hypothetical protein
VLPLLQPSAPSGAVTGRCYDPGRMRFVRALRRPVRFVGWIAVAAALALGGAGLIGQLSHPPGDARREELTYTRDVALKTRLDAVAAQLTDVETLVDGLSGDAKSALIAVASGDGSVLRSTLDDGTTRAATAESSVAAIRATFADVPGGDPSAAAEYANATLARRAALLSALDSITGLSDLWGSVTARATDAAALTLAIRSHDATVAAAASLGVQAQYPAAIAKLDAAAALLARIEQIRRTFVSSTDSTVLDDWVARHARYDTALEALYKALRASHGKRNPTVDADYREENLARDALPPDNRAIVVIVAEVSQAGLTQAVLAIEGLRGQIDQALGAVSPG